MTNQSAGVQSQGNIKQNFMTQQQVQQLQQFQIPKSIEDLTDL